MCGSRFAGLNGVPRTGHFNIFINYSRVHFSVAASYRSAQRYFQEHYSCHAFLPVKASRVICWEITHVALQCKLAGVILQHDGVIALSLPSLLYTLVQHKSKKKNNNSALFSNFDRARWFGQILLIFRKQILVKRMILKHSVFTRFRLNVQRLRILSANRCDICGGAVCLHNSMNASCFMSEWLWD